MLRNRGWWKRVGVIGLLLAWVLTAARAAVEGDFDPNANGNVYAVAVQPDGKVVIGGGFTSLQPRRDRAPVVSQRIARLNPDGSLDEEFATALDGDVLAIAVQADGRILVAGKFTQAQTNANAPGVARNGLVRLERNGAIDETFDPNLTGAPLSQAQVYALAVQPDGRILIGGGFTALQPRGAGTAIARGRIARLLADGSVDAGFDPRANSLVLALTLQPDGRILLGGGFTTLQPNGAAGTTERRRVARLEADGSVDPSFAVRANDRVLAIAVEPNGTILLGGDFSTLQPANDEVTTTRSHLARVTADGQLDGDFNPRPNAAVTALAVQRDGKILAAGSFATFYAQETGATLARRYLARLDRQGAVDPNFNPGPNAAVAAIALQPDGRIVAGGYFSRVQQAGATLALQRNRIARFQADGALDAAFATDADGRVLAVTAQADGQVYIGGFFSSFAGATRSNLVRVKADGRVDPHFHPDVNGAVTALAVQADGRLLVAGEFNAIDGVPRSYFARLNVDGTVDASFDPAPSGAVSVVQVESDGRILVAGGFTSFRPNNADTSTTRSYLARLNADGSVDSWAPSIGGPVLVVTRQSDGKFLLGGSFTAVGGTTRNYLARINADGSLDGSFDPNASGTVRAIVVQADGRIVFGGDFATLQLDDQQGDDDDGDEKKDDDADRRALARVNADGSLDLNFNPAPGGNVEALALLPDGRLLVAGAFTYLQPGGAGAATVARTRLARFNADGTIDDTFDLGANERVAVLTALSDGRVFVGGSFTSLFSPRGEAAAADNHVLRLLAGGAIDASWRVRGPELPGSRVDAIAQLDDGRVLIGGDFERVGGGVTTDLALLTADGTVDTSFAPSTDGQVRALLVQPTNPSDSTRGNAFAWLQPGGTFRPSFNHEAAALLNGRVNAIAVQPDGAVIVGGFFSNRAGTTSRELARFRADGSLDTSFDPAPNATVSVVQLQPDGKILVAGAFTTIAGQDRSRLARLNADGSLDGSFAPVATNANIAAVLVQADGKILIGGSFTSFDVNDGENDDDDLDGLTNDDTGRKYLARLNADGSLDNTFRPEPNGAVAALLMRPDGKLLVGGNFTSFQPNGAGTATTRSYFAVLNSDATLDAFDAGLGGSVTAMAWQPDGKLLIGGVFSLVQLDDHEGDDDDGDGTTTDDANRTNLIRLNADMTLDAGFAPTPNGQVNAIAVQSGGRILIGGAFTILQPNGASVATTRNFLARLQPDGTVDLGFNPNANGEVQAIVVREDDSFLVGGAFTALRPDAPIVVAGEFRTIGGVALPNLARLNIDGNPDGSFAPAPDGAVLALVAEPDGGMIVGGAFRHIAGAARERLARIQPDGTLGALNLAIDGTVSALARQGDGALLIGGDFATVAGVARTRLARVASGGAVDPSFAVAVNGPVTAIAVQADGRIVLAGQFTEVAGVRRERIARLMANGSLDPSFDPAANGAVLSVALCSDGGIWAAGEFTRIGGAERSRLARLHADGTADAAFDQPVDAVVHTVTALEDGRALAGGEFSLVGAVARTLIARVDAGRAATQTLEANARRTEFTWRRAGGSPELSAVSFHVSTDRQVWHPLGAGTPVNGTAAWRWTGEAAAPEQTLYYVRMRGIVASTRGATSGVVEQVWQFFNSEQAGMGYPRMNLATESDAVAASAGAELPRGDASGGTSAGAISGVSSAAAPVEVSGARAARIANVALLTRLTGSERVRVSVTLAGNEERPVLVRASGTGLAAFGESAGVRQLALEVTLADGSMREADAAALAAELGAFPVVSDEGNSAVARVVTPQEITVEVWDRQGSGGAVLVEIYDAGSEGLAAATDVPRKGGVVGFVVRQAGALRIETNAPAPVVRDQGGVVVPRETAAALGSGSYTLTVEAVGADGEAVTIRVEPGD